MNGRNRVMAAMTVGLLLLAAIPCQVSGQGRGVTRIRFKRGASSATVSGRIAKDEVRCFVLGTREGQELDAMLRSPSKTIQFPFVFGAAPEKGGKRYSKPTSDGDTEVCIENYKKATTFSLTISVR